MILSDYLNEKCDFPKTKGNNLCHLVTPRNTAACLLFKFFINQKEYRLRVF